MKLGEYLLQERGRTVAVARQACLAPAFLSQIALGHREAPPARTPALEKATNFHVRRWDLRPRDWHLIWPELVGTDDAPSPPEDEVRDAAAA